MKGDVHVKKTRKTLCIIIGIVMILSLLASCGQPQEAAPSSEQQPAQTGGGQSEQPAQSSSPAPAPSSMEPIVPPPAPTDPEVKFATDMDLIIDNNKIAVINPFLSASNNSPTCWVFNLIYDKLVYGLGEGEYGPGLAKSWETDDWQSFTFHLRDDVDFHNGEHFTAEDVIYTITMAQDSIGAPIYDRWSRVVTATASDPYTLDIVLDDVDVDFFYNISQPQAGIVNQKAIDADPDFGTWIGTGCWYVTNFIENDSVKLARNDNYWGEKAITERMTLRFVPEMATKLMQLQNGETDVCFSLDPVDMPMIEADTENYVCYKYTYNNCDLIGFNMDDPICSDWNFRMAVISALDKEEITIAACGDYGLPETEGTLYGFGTEFRNHDIPVVPYDVDKALEYLDASPYNGEEIEIATAIITNIIATEVIQEQLSRIGIKTRINQMDPPGMGAYAGYGNNQSQMIMYVGPQTLSAASYRNLYYPGAGYNRVSYNNPEVTALLDLAPTVTDVNERRDLYMHIQEIIAEDPPYFNLFWLVQMAACVKGVGGMVLPADSYFDLRYI